ncbi:MAG: PKD domain-containing protein [Gammaproteobacteria bacterium]|nr:PKD domain-containing protein [Gammaproteobacteria bacterium]NIS51239.1 PKD domain-containing protein [Phycisphaerae bacterium]NIW45042.1 PKD domain-containing protein [Gammaproteobacteria bacterium]NIW98537.1 PKD domain-containing protein [Phycisphaerae bacterium]
MAYYYVDGDSGNDNNSGTSVDSAWKTFSYAIGSTSPVTAGDTVYLRETNAGYNPSTGKNNFTISKNGRSGSPITFKNYSTETPTINGGFIYPTNSAVANVNPRDGTTSYWGALVNITGAYIVWDGINITESVGRGLLIQYTNNVTVQNCKIYWNRMENIQSYYSDWVTIDNVEAYEAGCFARYSRSVPDHPGCITGVGNNNTTVQNCVIHSNFTEGILFDGNWGASSGITIQDNIIYDCAWGKIYVHAMSNAIIQRNVSFVTLSERLNPFYGSGGIGISISSQEQPVDGKTNQSIDGVKVVNNIIGGSMIDIRGFTNSGGIAKPLINLTVANNTVVAGTSCRTKQAIRLQPPSVDDVIIKNNIFYGYDSSTSVYDAGGMSSIDFDYNWWGTTPDSRAAGANDGGPGDPGLVDATWTPDIDPSGTYGALRAYRSLPSTFAISNYALDTGGSAINAGADLTSEFATSPAADNKDYWETVRSATWDIGAHEYGGVSTPTATITPDVSTGNAPLTVAFTGGASGGTSPYTYYWDFGTGDTSTTQSPSYTFQDYGTYTVTLTVTDSSTEGLTGTDTQTITVDTSSPGTIGPVAVEQVILDAGDASYAVTAEPKAILMVYGGGISDGTAASNAQFGAGIFSNTASNQYALGTVTEDGVSTTNAATNMISGSSVLLMNPNETTLASGAVSSTSSSAVNMSWSGTTSSEKIVTWNFSGSGVSNVTATTIYMAGYGTTATLNGDYNVIIMPANLAGINSAKGNADGSLGFAVRGGSQMCLGWSEDDDETTADVRGIIHTDRIAYRPRGTRNVEITSWTAAQVEFSLYYGDVYGEVPLLAMKIEGADIHLGVENMPTTTGAVSYTTAGFDAQVCMLLLSNLTATDTRATDTSAGVAGICSVNSGGTDRTIIKSSKDAATGTMVEKSYTNANYSVLDHTGTVVGEGAHAIITNGFSVNQTTAPSTAYKAISFLIEETTTGNGPNAAFVYTNEGTDYPNAYGDTITFTSRSEDDGNDQISGYNWDWGDGTAAGTSNPDTHVYTTAGIYRVTLTVTDDNSDTDSVYKDITITEPTPTVVATLTPEIGAVPLTVALDASTSTPGGDEVWDEEATQWLFWHYDWVRRATPNYYATGITTSVEIEEPGEYFVELRLFTQSGTENGGYYQLKAYVDPEIDFYAQDGQISTPGPYVANFELISNRDDIDNVTISWDFGDTGTDSDVGLISVTHTYAAVGTTTAYDVEVTAPFPEETETLTKEGYITIVATPTTPPTIDELIAEIDALSAMIVEGKKHIGCMDDGTWVRHGTYTDTYYTALNRTWADGYHVIVKENGANLTEQTSIADVNSNAGSFYITFADPTLTVYVHTSGSDNPSLNSDTYSLRFLTYNIHINEPVTVTEDADMFLLSINVTDSVTVGEDVNVNVQSINVSDSVTVGDSVSVSIT